MTEPRERADARMPLYAPLGCPKTRGKVSTRLAAKKDKKREKKNSRRKKIQGERRRTKKENKEKNGGGGGGCKKRGMTLTLSNPKQRRDDSHSFQAGRSCAELIICESNPDVISMPMTQGNNRKYIRRRFGFFHQGTGSSIAMRWIRSSSSSLPPPMVAGVSRCKL